MVVAGLVLALVATGCGGSGGVEGIVVITLDTTRADRIGCYGYERAETPHLDRLAAEGVVFDQAMAPVPVTLPSHASMFTGLYPPTHGVRYNGMFRLGPESVTVAELLRDAGWATAAAIAAYPVTAKSGIDQGFDAYLDPFTDEDEASRPEHPEIRGDVVTESALDWLRGRPDGPFFLWIHYYDPHAPWNPPFPWSSTHRDRPYDGEIAFTDSEIGRVLDALDGEGILDDVVILVVGDHGEGLYDHGEKMHCNLVYQSTMRAPLIVRSPDGRQGARVDDPVSVVDVAPTVLDYAGLAIPEMHGASLRPMVQGAVGEERVQYFETLAGSLVYGWSPLDGIRKGRWKYIRSPSPELYDLESDPGEERNVVAEHPDVAAEMDALLDELVRRWEAQAGSSETVPVPLDPEELDRLASLGYIGGAIVEAERVGPLARDLVHLETTIQYAVETEHSGAYDESFETWARVIEADPENRRALHGAARTASKAGRVAEAVSYGTRLVEVYPEFQPGWVTLGEIHAGAGEYAPAVETFRRGLEHHPDEEALQYRLAVALVANEDYAEAERHVGGALSRPDAAESFLVLQALLRSRRGDFGGAEESLRQAIAGGYAKRDVLLEEPLLEPLRDVPSFEAIVDLIPEEPSDEGSDR
jgi:arylsulfatase A-like enzyme